MSNHTCHLHRLLLSPHSATAGALHARYGREGSGGRDLQVGSMRWHQESQKHEDAVRKQQHLLTEVENQKRMEDFVANDPEGARIIRLLRAMLFICKEDAPISMFTRLVGFMAHEGVKDVPKQSYGVYITHCDESTDRTRGKHLILFATFLKKRKVVTEFLALLTVDKCDAASLQAIILSHLETLGVDLQKISGIESLAVKDAAAAFPDFKIIDAVIRALGEIVGRSTPWYERFKHLQMIIHNTNLEHQGLYLIRWLSRGDAIKRLCSILGAAIVVLIEYNHKLAPVVKTLKFHYCLYFLADVLAEMNTLNSHVREFNSLHFVPPPALCPFRQVDITLVSQEVDRTVTYIRHRYIEYGATFGGGMSKRLTKFLQRHASGKRSIVVDGMDNDGSPCTHAFELSEEKLPGHKFGGSMSDCEDLCSAFAKDMVANVEQRLWDLKRMGGARLFKVECWPKKAEVRERRHLSWLASNVALFDHKLPAKLMTINMLDYDMDYAEIVDIWRKQKMRKQAKTVAYETPLDKGKSAAEDSDEEIAGS
ncbi:hypothetical protein CLOM_g15133 [Closterium sp. NIES-68]|nr:hypothetical protein CLOM_g15133 [Closterium sp. NIES-68]